MLEKFKIVTNYFVLPIFVISFSVYIVWKAPSFLAAYKAGSLIGLLILVLVGVLFDFKNRLAELKVKLRRKKVLFWGTKGRGKFNKWYRYPWDILRDYIVIFITALCFRLTPNIPGVSLEVSRALYIALTPMVANFVAMLDKDEDFKFPGILIYFAVYVAGGVLILYNM